MSSALVIGVVVIVAILVMFVLWATGCFKPKKPVSTEPPEEAKKAAEVIVRQAAQNVLEKTKSQARQAKQARDSQPAPVRLPMVCKVWDRWQFLDNDLYMRPGHSKNLLGDGWLKNTCPAKHFYQQINHNDYWCAKPETKGDNTAILCSQYISNDKMAAPVPPTCVDNSPLAPFDRWVQLREPLGVAMGTYQGSAWNGTVCPQGACYQLLNNQENWCVPIENVQQGTTGAAEDIIPIPTNTPTPSSPVDQQHQRQQSQGNLN